MRILVVDDDRDLVALITFTLTRGGLETIVAYDPAMAMQNIGKDSPDLVLLDVNMGPWSGFDLLQQIRGRSTVPIIMLTGRDAEDDKVMALDLGADDYVVKPFSHRELLARVKANLRRHKSDAPTGSAGELLKIGDLTLDPRRHEVRKGRKLLKLTPTEFKLLRCLMLNPNAVVPAGTLLEEVWGYHDPGAGAVLRATTHRLRNKLEADPGDPKLVRTIPGVGVILVAPT
ncbi:MAG TPA: response regulator transcription factor [Chloroflexota bacterium]|nr:response regulator transcription factor [Chloroflexota bacterium]